MSDAEIYHRSDNSWGGILGGLVSQALPLVVDNLIPTKAATQQTLVTPGVKPVPASASSFNWKPWAIGGGILAAVGVGLFLALRKP